MSIITHLIFSDFSDTMVCPSTGDKFPPFELELGKLVAREMTKKSEREKFVKLYREGYESFAKIRRDQSIPYSERVLIWLKPFTGRLSQRHFKELTKDFRLNEGFLKVARILKEELGLSELEITVVSGTATQLIGTFLNRKDVAQRLKKDNIIMKIEATELIMDKEGIFIGGVRPINELVYLGFAAYPPHSLVIGDNSMARYDFGRRLLNAQSFNRQEVKERIREYLATERV
jgi:hypothetical protein